ncbi:hypothetical protein QDW36_gp38 [Microbacterium phage Avocadoman]|uniref:hypothetical protein n=1 Tax=Microbacterium phage Albright TaxID=2816467 RepID=UPI0018A55F93|nr:hypothetical protein QDW28_gp37 [Microbacterium phage Albright]YP_010753121.1 hypothetical protein QDW33_gp38 [Microbacterium phage Doobus]YP_010753327.1 hypothetical protein QDW36_gp38 [Microbacterium phage Avocadoman]YP_010753396.1 hypothetical protein QDW37_gp38 [Microbacterium phage Abigail]WIC89528.1 hypothetical protein SEA_LIMABEAN_38 [Microbacterium phage LimaBean]QOP64867.1 hypothetical protein SEA_AVOCADOMAN_38 [Microbacterium phage Avocadoman]QTF82212.1 hypothetical protein SEA_
MSEPTHDAQLAGMMSLNPVEIVDVNYAAIEERLAAAYSGPSPILVRRDSRQAWAQAKPLDVLKDMAPERLADWVDGMNEVAGFTKYKVA